MKTPLINGISQTGLETYMTARTYDALYWPNFFPLKTVPTLDGKTIVGSTGNRVAAYIISYDATTPEIKRKGATIKYFDIPKTAVAIRKSEREILEHQILKNTIGMNAVIEDIFADSDVCYNGVQGRMEWTALQLISATKFTLSTTNNPLGIINETAVDSGMATANKKCVTGLWSSGGSTGVPITDFKAVAAAGRTAGVKLAYALMDRTAYDYMTACTEYVNAVKQVLSLDTTYGVTPLSTVDITNRVMRSLGLPEVVLIDTYVDIENAAGTRTSTNPWSSNHVTFVPSMQCGDFYAGPIAEEIEKPLDVLQTKRGPVLVSIRKEFNPSAVLTKAEANVFPSWSNVDQCYSLYLDSTATWS